MEHKTPSTQFNNMDIQKALEYYANNPNDPRKSQFDQRLKSGAFDVQLQAVGLQRQGNNIVKSNLPPVKQGVGIRGKQIFRPQTETGIDLSQTLEGISNSVQRGKQRVEESVQAGGLQGLASRILPGGVQREALRGLLNPEQQTGTETFGQILGAAGSTASNIAGEALVGAGKVLLPEESEQKIQESFSEALEPVAPIIQEVNNELSNIEQSNPRLFNNIKGIIGMLEGLATISGTSQTIKGAQKGFIQARGTLKNQWDDFVRKTEVVDTTPNTATVDEALASPEFGLTKDIAGVKKIGDESQFLTIPEKRKLLEIDKDLGNEYIDTLLKSEDSFDNITPFEKAVIDTENVVKQYESSVNKLGGEIGQIKDKLKTLSVDKSQINEVVNEISEVLKGKGVAFDGLKFKAVRGVNSPFTKADIKALNTEIGDTLNNIRNSSSMENLLLGMERLDNKINFNLSSDLTNSLQGISKSVRGKLKSIRNKALSKEESKLFEDFSDTKTFIDEFAKGNLENKIMSLLNVVGSKRDLKLKRIAEEIKRVTGQDITDYAYLARILSEASGSQSRNRSLLNQYIGEAMTLSPTGIAGRVASGIANKLINVDKLKEVQKAINFSSKGVGQ